MNHQWSSAALAQDPAVSAEQGAHRLAKWTSDRSLWRARKGPHTAEVVLTRGVVGEPGCGNNFFELRLMFNGEPGLTICFVGLPELLRHSEDMLARLLAFDWVESTSTSA